MSWLFGKKKNKESPSETADEGSTSSNQDDYIIVEKQDNLFDKTSNQMNDNTSANAGLYPFLNDQLASTSMSDPRTAPPENILGDSQSYLNLISFKLNPEFNRDFEINRIQIDEILSFILRMTSENYDYDFSLEEGVIAELQSAEK